MGSTPPNSLGVTSVHVQGEETAVFAADSTSMSLQLYTVVVPHYAVAPYEGIYGGNKWTQAVAIEVVRAKRSGLEMNGQPVRITLCERISIHNDGARTCDRMSGK